MLRRSVVVDDVVVDQAVVVFVVVVLAALDPVPVVVPVEITTPVHANCDRILMSTFGSTSAKTREDVILKTIEKIEQKMIIFLSPLMIVEVGLL